MSTNSWRMLYARRLEVVARFLTDELQVEGRRSRRCREKPPHFFMMLALNEPHRPLSALITMTSTFFGSRARNSGCASASARVARLFNTSSIFLANGRADKMASWARRSFAADTIFMADVICWVFLTLLVRRLRSRRLGMVCYVRAPAYAADSSELGLNWPLNSSSAILSLPSTSSSSFPFSTMSARTPGWRSSR